MKCIIDQWEANMVKYGRQHGEYLVANKDGNIDDLLARTFYDSQRVYQQISEYRKEADWLRYAEASMHAYRDRYVIPNGGAVQGFRNFTKGIYNHFSATGDRVSADCVKMLADKGAYGPEVTPIEWTANAVSSRDVAYQILAKLDSEKLGNPRVPKLKKFVDQAFGHIDQWFVSKTAPYIQPFMVGLTAEALIEWYNVEKDRRVLPAIVNAAEKLWCNTWVKESFVYVDKEFSGVGSPVPTSDLNMLICPMYAWIYTMTGQNSWKNMALAIMAGSFGTWFDGPKQFNQNYRWSFDCVRWLKETPGSTY